MAENIFSIVFIQIIVSLVLLILFSFDFSNSNLFTKFVYVGGIYALIKANTIVREFIGGISTKYPPQTVQNFSPKNGEVFYEIYSGAVCDLAQDIGN
ncbi:MAG: hypothetical protein ACLTXR_05985 [Clostridia bacterium]